METKFSSLETVWRPFSSLESISTFGFLLVTTFGNLSFFWSLFFPFGDHFYLYRSFLLLKRSLWSSFVHLEKIFTFGELFLFFHFFPPFLCVFWKGHFRSTFSIFLPFFLLDQFSPFGCPFLFCKLFPRFGTIFILRDLFKDVFTFCYLSLFFEYYFNFWRPYSGHFWKGHFWSTQPKFWTFHPFFESPPPPFRFKFLVCILFLFLDTIFIFGEDFHFWKGKFWKTAFFWDLLVSPLHPSFGSLFFFCRLFCIVGTSFTFETPFYFWEAENFSFFGRSVFWITFLL